MILLNGQKIAVTTFPDQTSQVWKVPDDLLKSESYLVTWSFESEAELLHIAQLKALLDIYSRTTKLEITYLPYARQDKEIANDATFALRPFANLLNAMKFNEIEINDPHSVLAVSLIQNSKAEYPTEKVKHVVEILKADLICYPDKGARTRYGAIYTFNSIYGEKVRNQQSGQITSYEVVGDAKNKNVLIIDDICDGGATFIYLARELIAQGAKSVSLFVTHGLFTRGLQPLHDSGISRIFSSLGEAVQVENKITYKEIRL